MPTVEEVVRDPDFQGLPFTERRNVLIQIDPDFAGMQVSEQNKTLAGLKSKPFWQGGARAESRDPFSYSKEEAEKGRREFVSREGTTLTKIKEKAKQMAVAASPYVRPVLEGGGAVVGGILGAGGGSAVPGAGTVAGGIAGSGLGYAIGKQGADTYDEVLGLKPYEELPERGITVVNDIATGATFEMGGQVIGKGINAAVRGAANIKRLGLPFSNKRNATLAGETLSEVMAPAPIAEEATAGRLAETKALAARTGIEPPTYAQASGNSKAAAFEQSMAAKNPDLADQLRYRDAGINQRGLEFLDEAFPGPENADDVLRAVGGEQTRLAEIATTAEQTASSSSAPLRYSQDPQAVGVNIQGALKEGKTAARAAASGLFDQVPNVKLKGDDLLDTVKAVKQEFAESGEMADRFPVGIVSKIERALAPKAGQILDSTGNAVSSSDKVSFDELRGWRSTISQQIRENSVGASPNLPLVRRLQTLKQGIDTTLDRMESMGGDLVEASTKYRQAKDFYRQYKDTFQRGQVGEVLQSGKLSTGQKVTFDAIPGRFFSTGKMDAADDLVRAVGPEKARNLIKDYASHDLLNKASTGGELQTGKVLGWVERNRAVLDKYGLTEEFTDLAKLYKNADVARGSLDKFNRGVASKILDSDVDKVVSQALQGKGSSASAKIMSELLATPGIKENPSAQKGLQNAFKDFFLKKVEMNQAPDVLGNPYSSKAKAKMMFDKYLPAMEVLFKDDPRKLQALKDYHGLLEMLSRNKNVSYSGGSTTAEKLKGVNIGKSLVEDFATLGAITAGKGWVFSAAKNIVKGMLSPATKYSQEQVNALLKDAIVNPETAETLIKLAREGANKGIDKQLDSHLATLGLYGVKNAVTDKAHESEFDIEPFMVD